MGSIFRSILGVPVAAIVVVALFLFMYGLIKNDMVEIEDSGPPPNIKIGRQLQDSEVTNQKRFDKPVLDQPPPPPPAINQATFKPNVDGVRAAVPTFEANVDIGTAFNPDRDAQPIVRIPPSEADFQRCIRSDVQKIERVSLQFDVTPQGQVTNVQVIDSTDRCYERSAIRSAEKWKYNPKIVEGQAQPRFGVRTVIVYQVGGQ
ncbi:energy transducer TonB [Parvularcula sp. LCG005]|uniref:energy transducer TonB family protein n=1 Tax=Parvularcula sp. LCG005 TaxID=3078805 RepID=UPI002942FEE1|nr:energy transducer TonB [Parvularcula sp. LCG005]WOI53625.1 energy transducer TonB [Parvularcula sp. LCG005]